MHDEPSHRDMPARMLRLLALLQSRREWSGAELATRLGITDRTLRRDIDRLRKLDYPVRGTSGTAGGYQLGAGKTLPPLLLDDAEAVSVATALVTAAGSTAGGIAGIDETAMRALAKLQQVLPARLRSRLVAVTDATAAVPHRNAPRVDPATLAVLASCCRDHEIVSFDYFDRSGTSSARRVEPHSLVTVQAHWYLLAFDPDRADWRTFRIDRVHAIRPTHRHFAARELPAKDAASYLSESFATAPYRHNARLTVQLPAATVRERLYTTLLGDVEIDAPTHCTLRLSAESSTLLTQQIAAIAVLGARYTLETDEEIMARLRELGRLLAAQ